MGDPRLLQTSRPVEAFGTPELHALIGDMQDTMRAANGAGLAAPQIGVNLRVVIFGFESNPRYPQAEPVPFTILLNPVLTPLSDALEEGWEGCLSVPGLRGMVPRWIRLGYRGFDADGALVEREAERISRPRCAARVRPPRRHPLSNAHPRLHALRLHGRPLPGRRHSRGLITEICRIRDVRRVPCRRTSCSPSRNDPRRDLRSGRRASR